MKVKVRLNRKERKKKLLKKKIKKERQKKIRRGCNSGKEMQVDNRKV